MTKFVDEAGVQAFANALVSSTKTINGQSIWGSGNIEMESQNSDGPIYLCTSAENYIIYSAVAGDGNGIHKDIVELLMSELESLTGLYGKELITYLLQHNSTFLVTNLDYESVDSESSASNVQNPAYFSVVSSTYQPSTSSDRDRIRFILVGKYYTDGSTPYEITSIIPGLLTIYKDGEEVSEKFEYDTVVSSKLYRTELEQFY